MGATRRQVHGKLGARLEEKGESRRTTIHAVCEVAGEVCLGAGPALEHLLLHLAVLVVHNCLLAAAAAKAPECVSRALTVWDGPLSAALVCHTAARCARSVLHNYGE